MFANVGMGGAGKGTRVGILPKRDSCPRRRNETFLPLGQQPPENLRPDHRGVESGVRGMFRRVPTPDPERLGSRLGCLGRARHPASEKCEGAHSSPAQGVTLGAREQSLIMTSLRQWVKLVWEVVHGERRAV